MHDSDNNDPPINHRKEYGVRETMNQRAMDVFVDLRELERISLDPLQALLHAQQEVRTQARAAVLVKAKAGGEIGFRLWTNGKDKFHFKI